MTISVPSINKSGAFHVDAKPILNLYREVVNLHLKFAEHEGLLPADRVADVDSILKKSDEVRIIPPPVIIISSFVGWTLLHIYPSSRFV